jgi:hypothetical protein
MRLQHEQASLSLPHVEIYLPRSKRPRKFVFIKGVPELVLCGGKAVCSFSIRIPAMLLRALPSPPANC